MSVGRLSGQNMSNRQTDSHDITNCQKSREREGRVRRIYPFALILPPAGDS